MKTKKVLLTAIALLSALSLCSCAKDTTDTSEDYIPTTTVSSTYKEPSKEESSKDESSKEDSSEEESENWILKYYVDDFGELTNDAYIMCTGEGSFSNSVTNKSDLLYAILYDKSKNEDSRFQIKLLEYGSYPVNNTYSSGRYYTIKVKCGSSTATKEGFMNSDNGDRIFVDSSNDIVECLKNGSDVTFSISQDDRPTTKYLFKVKADGFSKVYNQL